MVARAFPAVAGAYIPAVLGLAIFGAGHMFLPPVVPLYLAPPPMTEAEIAEADHIAVLRTERYYLRVRKDIVVSVPSLGQTVKVEVALALRNGEQKRIQPILETQPDDIITPLTEAVMAGTDGVMDLTELLEVLPPLLKDEMNRRLATEEKPEPVLEVMIINMAAGGCASQDRRHKPVIALNFPSNRPLCLSGSPRS
jgi:hypothetical protein